jgi:hypothetical protein
VVLPIYGMTTCTTVVILVERSLHDDQIICQ